MTFDPKAAKTAFVHLVHSLGREVHFAEQPDCDDQLISALVDIRDQIPLLVMLGQAAMGEEATAANGVGTVVSHELRLTRLEKAVAERLMALEPEMQYAGTTNQRLEALEERLEELIGERRKAAVPQTSGQVMAQPDTAAAVEPVIAISEPETERAPATRVMILVNRVAPLINYIKAGRWADCKARELPRNQYLAVRGFLRDHFKVKSEDIQRLTVDGARKALVKAADENGTLILPIPAEVSE